MTAQTIRNIIIESFKQQSPDLAAEGTAVADLITDPLAIFVSKYLISAERFIEQGNTESPQESLLDVLGSRFLVDRKLENKPSASITLYFDSSKVLDGIKFPAGSIASSVSGVKYALDQDVYLAKSNLSAASYLGRSENVVASRPLSFTALSPGSDNKVAAKQLSVPEFSIPGLIGITNELASTSGSSRESDEAYIERIRDSFSTRSMDTEAGIKYLIASSFANDVESIEVLSHSSPKMKRNKLNSNTVLASTFSEAEVALTRASGATSLITYSVDGVSVNMSASVSVAAHREGAFILNSGSLTISQAIEAIKSLPSDSIVFLFLKNTMQGVITDEEYDFVSSFFDISYRMEGKDLVCMGSHGGSPLGPVSYWTAGSEGDRVFKVSTSLINKVKGPENMYGFIGKKRGSNASNRSVAYKQISKFVESEVKLEVTQGEYASLIASDFDPLKIQSTEIFSDNFLRFTASGSPITKTSAVGNDWLCGNTGERKSQKDSSAGIFLVNGRLVMGPSKVSASYLGGLTESNLVSSEVISLVGAISPELKKQAEDLKSTLLAEGIEERKVNRLVSSFLRNSEAAVVGTSGISGNTSPVIQRPLLKEYGFKVTGTVKTSDTGDNLMLISSARTAPEEVALDTFKWYEGYGVAIGTAAEGSNIFIMDNAAASYDAIIAGDEVVSSKFYNNVLKQDSFDFDPNVNYEFDVTFTAPSSEDSRHAYGILAWFWPEGSTKPVTPTIEYGPYIPVNRQSELINFGEGNYSSEVFDAKANHIGFGVSSTSAKHAWILGNVKVENTEEVYSQALMDFDVSGYSEQLELRVVARGSGNKQVDQGGTIIHEEGYGVDLYLYNWITQAFELISSKKTNERNFVSFSDEVSDKYISRGIVRSVIRSAYPQGKVDISATPSLLDVDYAFIFAEAEPISLSGMADVVVTQIREGSSVLDTKLVPVTVGDSNTISADSVGGPIFRVKRVTLGEGQSQVELDSSEFYYFWEDESVRGSSRESLVLLVDSTYQGLSAQVEIEYGESVGLIQQFIDTHERRKIDGDLLVRHRSPVYFSLSLSATSTSEGVEQRLKVWLKERSQINIPELISFLNAVGVSSISLPSIQLKGTRILSYGGESITTITAASIASEYLNRESDEIFVLDEITIHTS